MHMHDFHECRLGTCEAFSLNLLNVLRLAADILSTCLCVGAIKFWYMLFVRDGGNIPSPQ